MKKEKWFFIFTSSKVWVWVHCWVEEEEEDFVKIKTWWLLGTIATCVRVLLKAWAVMGVPCNKKRLESSSAPFIVASVAVAAIAAIADIWTSNVVIFSWTLGSLQKKN